MEKRGSVRVGREVQPEREAHLSEDEISWVRKYRPSVKTADSRSFLVSIPRGRENEKTVEENINKKDGDGLQRSDVCYTSSPSMFLQKKKNNNFTHKTRLLNSDHIFPLQGCQFCKNFSLYTTLVSNLVSGFYC